MAASNIAVSEPRLDAINWDRLARLMDIPDNRSGHFIYWLQFLIEFEHDAQFTRRWLAAAVPPEQPADRRQTDADIAKACRVLVKAIEQRGTQGQGLGQSTPPELELIAAAILGYLDKCGVRAPKRGAPKRANKFARFLERVLNFTWASGGHVIFNRRAERGNIVDLLAELRPFMPPGFIPKELPMALLERLATKARGPHVRVDRTLVELRDFFRLPPRAQ